MSLQITSKETAAQEDVIVRRLRSIQELNDARALLYSVYIEEAKWAFSPQNPVGIRVEQLPDGRFILMDDFDPISIHMGAFQGERLIGTARFHFRNRKGQFQTTLYPSAKFLEPMLRDLERTQVVAEMNRMAMLPEYRRTTLLFKIIGTTFAEITSWGQASKQRVGFFATLNVAVENFLKTTPGAIPLGAPFKYEAQDPDRVYAFAIPAQGMQAATMYYAQRAKL